MAVGDRINNVEPFRAKVVPDKDKIDSSVELFQEEVELWLDELLDAVKTEIQEIADNCCP